MSIDLRKANSELADLKKKHDIVTKESHARAIQIGELKALLDTTKKSLADEVKDHQLVKI